MAKSDVGQSVCSLGACDRVRAALIELEESGRAIDDFLIDVYADENEIGRAMIERFRAAISEANGALGDS